MHANLLFWKIIAIGITMGFIGFFLDFTTDVEEEPRLSVSKNYLADPGMSSNVRAPSDLEVFTNYHNETRTIK